MPRGGEGNAGLGEAGRGGAGRGGRGPPGFRTWPSHRPAQIFPGERGRVNGGAVPNAFGKLVAGVRVKLIFTSSHSCTKMLEIL